PVNDRSDLRQSGTVSNIFRGRVSVDQLNPMQLRMPTEESDKQAVARIAQEYMEGRNITVREANKLAKQDFVAGLSRRLLVDPPPGKTGLVRDLDVRRRIRTWLSQYGVDPDDLTKRGDKYVVTKQIELLAKEQKIKHLSGVPIRSVVLLRTMKDP